MNLSFPCSKWISEGQQFQHSWSGRDAPISSAGAAPSCRLLITPPYPYRLRNHRVCYLRSELHQVPHPVRTCSISPGRMSRLPLVFCRSKGNTSYFIIKCSLLRLSYSPLYFRVNFLIEFLVKGCHGHLEIVWRPCPFLLNFSNFKNMY